MLGEFVLVILLWGLFCVFVLWLTEKLQDRYNSGRRRRSADQIWKESDR